MSLQGKIIDAYTAHQGEYHTVIEWTSEKGYFGQLTVIEDMHHNLEIKTELLSLETVAEILAKWLEIQKTTDEKT